MKALTSNELEVLQLLISMPEECATCNPFCACLQSASKPGTVTTLTREGRMQSWSCEYTNGYHGRITPAGRLAVRLHSLLSR